MIAMTEIYMGDTSEGGQIGSVESTVPDTTKLE